MRAALRHPWFPPLLLAGLSTAAILIAVASQYWGGLQPCVLCLYQRWAHGGVAAAGVLGAFAGRSGERRIAGQLTVIAALAALVGTGIALYHVGVEQQWWPGTSGCTGPALESGAGLDALRQQIEGAPIIRCSDIAWSLFGISMAGYNVLLSAGLAVFGFRAGRRMLKESA